MRLAFFCAALEPGRDGVGDYTRRLAAECIRLGHPAIIASLNDTHTTQLFRGTQEMDGTTVPALRLPSVMMRDARVPEAANWLETFNPDWVSLQFVPFGYHRKGLCFGLGKWLAAINKKTPWHLMLHELWQGLGENSRVKDRIIGMLQRRITLDFMGRLRPRMVHTQAEAYRMVLAREKIRASILPLFSNIARTDGDAWNDILQPLAREAIGSTPDRSKIYLAGILGGVHPEWNAEKAVDVLLPLTKRFDKRLVLVFHGNNGLSSEEIDNIKSSLRGNADVVVTGERTNGEISRILQSLDMGLATSPRQNIQKSGSAVAMLEHGLQVLVTRDDWRARGVKVELNGAVSGLIFPEQFARLSSLPTRNAQAPKESGVKRVADQLLASLVK